MITLSALRVKELPCVLRFAVPTPIWWFSFSTAIDLLRPFCATCQRGLLLGIWQVCSFVFWLLFAAQLKKGRAGGANSESRELRELPTAWLRRLGTRCEQDAANTLEIASKALQSKRPGFVVQPESRRLVSSAVMLAHCVQHVASLHELYLPSEINVALDMVLTRIRPAFPENNDAFHQVQTLITQIVGFLSDPDEKPPQPL
jgi:hypothetical protein